jgi:hypothetical protein
MTKIWRAALRVRGSHSGIEATSYGYGVTPEKALVDAEQFAAYRKELKIPGHKPKLDLIDEEAVTRQPQHKE